MILWFAIAQISIALVATVVCLWQFGRGRGTNDYTLGATLIVGILLLVQIVIGVVSPFAGNAPRGDPLEFWMYLVTAAILPFAAGFWALIDRKRSANLVLAIVHFSVAIMLYRMLVIWGWHG